MKRILIPIVVLVFIFLLFPYNIGASNDLDIDLGVPSGQPIFVLEDMKPGDSETREIEAKNNSEVDKHVSVKCEEIEEYKDFSEILEIIIKVNSIDIYGGSTGYKTVGEFCQEASNEHGIPLSILSKGDTTIYTFSVFFPNEAGNEYQKAKYIINIIFGYITTNDLVINEVYYYGEKQGCGCFCCGDFNMEECDNSPCSNNIYEYRFGNKCFSFQKRDSLKMNNPCNMYSSGSRNIKFSCNSVNLFNKYYFNYFSCGDWDKLKCAEWIELYNPTDRTIDLRNWYLQDNSGELVRIRTWKKLRPGEFALITKNSWTWRSWNEGEESIKIYLRRKIGDGLDDSGDHLHLINPSSTIVDSVGWGNDTAVWNPAVPGVTEGLSIKRLVPGYDTNSVSDWKKALHPKPGF